MNIVYFYYSNVRVYPEIDQVAWMFCDTISSKTIHIGIKAYTILLLFGWAPVDELFKLEPTHRLSTDLPSQWPAGSSVWRGLWDSRCCKWGFPNSHENFCVTQLTFGPGLFPHSSVYKKKKANRQKTLTQSHFKTFVSFCTKSANKNRPCHGPSGWMSVGSAPTVCFYPLWSWGESRDAPQWCGASAGHLTGCPETPDAGW